MATNTYDIRVNSTQAQQALERLQNSVKSTADTFSRLKGVLAGLVTGAAIANLYGYADAIDDIAKANALAVETVMGFSQALQANGGEALNAANALSTFTSNISEAADGSAQLQNTFRELGISLTDLATLSEQDLLRKTIAALGQLPDKAEQARKSTVLFGRALKGVELQGFANDLVKFTQSSVGNASAITAAAEASDNFQKAISTFKIELLAVLKPISELANSVLENTRAVATFIEVILKLGAVVVTFTLLGKVVQMLAVGFTALKAGIAAIGTAIVTARNGFAGFGLILENLGLVSLAGGLRVVIELLKQLGQFTIKSIPGIGAVAVAFAAVSDRVGQAIDKIKEYLGITKGVGGGRSGGMGGPTAEELAAYQKSQAAQEELRKVDTTARDNAFRQIRAITAEYARQIDLQQIRMGMESELSQLSQEEQQRRTQQFDLAQKYNETIEKLIEKRQSLNKNEQDQIPVINEQIKKIAELYVQQSQGLDTIINKQIVSNDLERQRQNTIEQINQQIQRQTNLGEQLQRANDRLRDVEFEGSLRNLTPYQQQLARIREDNRKAALEAGRAYAAQFENMDLTAQQSAEVARGLELIAERYRVIADEQTKTAESSRTFAEGWSKAFGEYVDNATNAANQARDVFQKATQGMEDAIVNFAKTGKFEFKNFLASIVEQILRSQIQQTIARVFGGGGGGGGGVILPFLKNILGFANGGIIPTNAPVIVGERGPELLMGAAGRQVVPNGQFGGTVVYNINAVDAASFKALVARDPAFIYAVTEQGRATLPRTRR
jgi:lambda family phage tail tape measure protein